MRVALRAVYCACFVFALTASLSAEPWKIDINSNLTTALNSYSDNWVGGEAGSFTWAAQFLGVAERQLSKSFDTKTTLNLQFGQTKTQNKNDKRWSAPQKSTDLIDGEELLRFTLGLWVDPFISVRAISQFLDGSDSTWVLHGNPVDITEAVGVSRTLIKSETMDWATRIGAAARQEVDREKLDTATGTRADDVTNDGGVEFNMDLKVSNIKKWVTLNSALRVYEALLSTTAEKVKETSIENNWRYPHVKWENTLTLTFAKYLMLNFSLYTYYDREIAYNWRLKETLSAGLTYNFSKK
jgi:hypothetical protein